MRTTNSAMANRRGILGAMMTYLLDECAARGGRVSMLTASEGGIYRRFGYGVASRVLEVELRRAEVAFERPVTEGRLRMVEPEEGKKLLGMIDEIAEIFAETKKA